MRHMFLITSFSTSFCSRNLWRFTTLNLTTEKETSSIFINLELVLWLAVGLPYKKQKKTPGGSWWSRLASSQCNQLIHSRATQHRRGMKRSEAAETEERYNSRDAVWQNTMLDWDLYYCVYSQTFSYWDILEKHGRMLNMLPKCLKKHFLNMVQLEGGKT